MWLNRYERLMQGGLLSQHKLMLPSPVFRKFNVPAHLERDLLEFYQVSPHFALSLLSSYRTELKQLLGVYIFFYRGPFDLYQDISMFNRETPTKPIYVGKAVSGGSRTGSSTSQSSLYDRLSEHRSSVRAANTTLSVDDFDVRVIPMDFDLVQWAEAVLIRRLKPLWNSKLSGFGIHGPGGGRNEQGQSIWDQIHPGRSFTRKMPNLTPFDYADLKTHLQATLGIDLEVKSLDLEPSTSILDGENSTLER